MSLEAETEFVHEGEERKSSFGVCCWWLRRNPIMQMPLMSFACWQQQQTQSAVSNLVFNTRLTFRPRRTPTILPVFLLRNTRSSPKMRSPQLIPRAKTCAKPAYQPIFKLFFHTHSLFNQFLQQFNSSFFYTFEHNRRFKDFH